jgi:type I restriction enzyme, S subunit
MSNDLPEGWACAKLGEITTKIGSGATPRGGSEFYENQGVPLIRSMNVRFEGFTIEGLAFLNKAQAKALDTVTVKSGDVLLNITGASIGRVTQAPPSMDGARVNQHVCIIRPKPELDAAFLARFLASPLVQRMIWTEQYGVTRQALTKAQILAFDVPLPPLSEQQRIVAKMESVFSQVHACQQRLARIPTLLKRFRQSVLAAACSGRLTADWRTLSSVEQRNWGKTTLTAVADMRLGKMLDGAKNVGNLTPYLRNLNVRWFSFDLSHLAQMRATSEERREFDVKDGDLLVCEGGEPGRCAIWNFGSTEIIFQKAIHRIRLGNSVIPQWVALNLKNDADSGFLQDYFTGSTIKHLTGRSLESYTFRTPPIDEQREIARGVMKLLALADQIEARFTEGRKRVDSITQAILAKAFRGELVPTEHEVAEAEGRSFESAEELLARIRAANEARSNGNGVKPRKQRNKRNDLETTPRRT